MPENVGKHCRQWPADKTESDQTVLIQENSKPQDFVCILMAQSPKNFQFGASLPSEVLLPSLNNAVYIHSLSLQFDNGNRNSHP